MDSMLENEDEPSNVKYSPKMRKYYLKSLIGPYSMTIEFCPWCGLALPKNLNDEWYDILERECNLDPWIPEEEAKISVEFLTDEWWKKRGL
jgi:hypothetical protein